MNRRFYTRPIYFRMSTVFLLSMTLLAVLGAGSFVRSVGASESKLNGLELPANGAAAGSGVTPHNLTAIDAYIEAEMGATQLPGLALGIVAGEQIVHLRGFGRADSSGRIVTPQTPFLIASVTKPISAIAIMQLVEAGKLDLDAPVQRYLPWFTVADPEAAAQITIRQLLSHTSGLPTLTNEDGMVFDHRLGENALAERVRVLHRTPLSAAPGERFQYSNAGYAVLGLLIQSISGLSYEQYVREHIYKPLEMEHSFVSKSDAQRQGLATGHRYLFGFPAPYDWSYNLAELGAGFTYASAEDLARLLVALLNDGRYADAQLLTASSIATMQQPQVTFEQGETSGAYGLGWYIQDREGIRMVSHAGVAPNYRAELILVPERRLGIALLMNGESPLQPRIGHIAHGVTSLLVDQKPPTITSGSVPSVFNLVMLGSAVQIAVFVGSILLLNCRWNRFSNYSLSTFQLGVCHTSFGVLHLLWGLFCLIFVPRLIYWPLSDLALKLPDLGYTLKISGIFAIVWAIVYPVLAILVFHRRKPEPPFGLLASVP